MRFKNCEVKLFKAHNKSVFSIIGSDNKRRYVSYLVSKKRGAPLKYAFEHNSSDKMTTNHPAYKRALKQFKKDIENYKPNPEV